jgi:hypothetical protein
LTTIWHLFVLASDIVGVVTMAASAQDTSTKLPHFAKTLAELSAVEPTGGAGGSGNAKVQVVTIVGEPSKPGPYAQLLKVAANAQIAAHQHAGERVGAVLKGHLVFRLWRAVRQGPAKDAACGFSLHRTVEQAALRNDRRRAGDRPCHWYWANRYGVRKSD